MKGLSRVREEAELEEFAKELAVRNDRQITKYRREKEEERTKVMRRVHRLLWYFVHT